MSNTVTEYFEGAYRVTRCDAHGRAERTTTMARILTPTAVAPFVVIEEQTARTRVCAPVRRPRRARLGTRRGCARLPRHARRRSRPRPRSPPTSTSARASPRADDSCRNGSYRTFNRWRTRRYAYRVNTRTMSAAFRRAVVRGHHGLGPHAQPLRLPRSGQHRLPLPGRTAAASIHTKPDGRSMVDRGRARPVREPGHARLAWTFTDAGGRIVETDQRYGSRWRWSTRGRPGYYDVESAAAHETGHSIGLGHTTTSRYLTMHHQLCAGCTFARSLGRGDIRGLRALY